MISNPTKYLGVLFVVLSAILKMFKRSVSSEEVWIPRVNPNLVTYIGGARVICVKVESVLPPMKELAPNITLSYKNARESKILAFTSLKNFPTQKGILICVNGRWIGIGGEAVFYIQAWERV